MQGEVWRLAIWLLWTLIRRFGDRVCGGVSERRERVPKVGVGLEAEGFPVGFRGKIYAVRRGYSPGLYGSWVECERQVRGYKGAQFKSFWLREEAEKYMSLF